MPGVLKSLQRTELSACDASASFLQSGFWGGFKARFGWEALAFKIVWDGGACENGESEGGIVTPLLVLCSRIGPGISFAYVPWGPEFPAGLYADDEERWAALKTLAVSLKESLLGKLSRKIAFIRFDPPWYSSGALEVSRFLPPHPFIRAGADIQPPDTVLVDLNESMESIAAQMKPKWRYNARLALKKGVTISRAGPEKLDNFYTLLKETARRDGIAIHSIEYYRALFEESPPSCVSLYLAEHEGDLLAGIVTLFRGREAVYLYGASSDKKRNLMAPYALQMKAMEDAKGAGCEVYDLFGIPPGEDPNHPMAGLYRFKTGFGGRIVHRPGSWDYPCRPLIYRSFRLAETFRKNLRTLKKNLKKPRREN